ncbi:MAG TPA: RNA polymerase-binding protein RbpA [Pseudonocardiaceae bacterium]|nr:RNA polymerase-binding protein RbpA [Pseudonocardiaceae bacterium]
MGRGALRGYRGGYATVEPDRDDDLAPRVTAQFACTKEHEFSVQFAADANVPEEWICRQHGVEHCRRIEVSAATVKPLEARKGKPPRTPLVLLRERRTEAELEALLADTLAAIHRLGGARHGCVIIGSRPYSFRFDA